MSYKKDLLYAKKDGKGGTIWIKVGFYIMKENGKEAIKLDTIPIGFDGWLMVGTDKREGIGDRKVSAQEVADGDIPF